MARKRLGYVDRIAEFQAIATAIAAHNALTRVAKKAAYAATHVSGVLRIETKRVPGWVIPFGQNAATGLIYLKAQILSATAPSPVPAGEVADAPVVTGVVTGCAPFVLLATSGVPAGNTTGSAKGSVLARVSAKVPKGAGIAGISRLTGLPYTHVPTHTASSVFGETVAGPSPTEKEISDETAIMSAIKVSEPTAIVTIRPQGKIIVNKT
ncbi:MAG: hypothetical protein ABI417_08960 [Coleofasciculaceae cyanobacterium]